MNVASFTVPRADRAGDAHPLYSGPMETQQGRLFAIVQRMMPTSEEIRPWAYWYAHGTSLDGTGGVLKSILRVTSQKGLTAVR